jgi:seryl-tRNA synthetase
MKAVLMVLAVTCAVAVMASAFFLRESAGTERLRELEQEVASLRQQLQASAQRPPSSGNTTAPATATAQSSAASFDLRTLTRQMDDLSAALARLERSAQELDQRISRSKLALPTRQEREVRVAGMQRELDAQTRKSQEAAAEVWRLARQYGVELDPRALTTFDFPTPLDKRPDFNEARTRAIQAARVREAAEIALATERLEYMAMPSENIGTPP